MGNIDSFITPLKVAGELRHLITEERKEEVMWLINHELRSEFPNLIGRILFHLDGQAFEDAEKDLNDFTNSFKTIFLATRMILPRDIMEDSKFWIPIRKAFQAFSSYFNSEMMQKTFDEWKEEIAKKLNEKKEGKIQVGDG